VRLEGRETENECLGGGQVSRQTRTDGHGDLVNGASTHSSSQVDRLSNAG
jgi:hypothetical protein